MAFATVDDLEDRLRVTFTVAEEVQAAALLDSATALIKDEADQFIEQVVGDVVTLNGTGTRILLLPELPVTAVTTVVEDGVTLVFDDDFQWDRAGVLLRVGGVWPREARVVTVTYTHGWAAAELAALKAVCVEMAARAWSTGTSGAVRQESIGSYTVTYAVEPGSTSGLALTDAERLVVGRYGAQEPIVF